MNQTAAGIRLGRVAASGLLAGLVLNVGEALLHGVVLAEPTQAAMVALGRTGIGTGMDIASLVGITFVQGIVAIWLYAAVRPRLPGGLIAAVVVGLLVWVLSAVYAAIYLSSGLPRLLPASVVWWPVAWEFIEFPVGVIAGAWMFDRLGATRR